MQIPIDREASNFPISALEVIVVRKSKLAMLNMNNIESFLLANVEVCNFVHQLINFDTALHPVWLALINMLINDHGLLQNFVLRKDLLIKPLVVLVYDQFRMAQVLLQVIKSLVGAIVVF